MAVEFMYTNEARFWNSNIFFYGSVSKTESTDIYRAFSVGNGGAQLHLCETLALWDFKQRSVMVLVQKKGSFQ